MTRTTPLRAAVVAACACAWLASAAAAVPPPVAAGTPSPRLEFVAVRDADLQRFGKFPFDRKVLAGVVHQLRLAGAQAVVLKVFLDQPTASDEALAAEIRQMPTWLQSALVRVHTRPEDQLLEGDENAPVPVLRTAAAGTGMANARLVDTQDRIELGAFVGDRPVRSLVRATAELATGQSATLVGRSLALGHETWPLDEQGRAQCAYGQLPVVEPMSFGAALDGDAAALRRFKGKVVVVGYLASDSPTVTTAAGERVPAHRVFMQQAECLSRAGQAPKK